MRAEAVELSCWVNRGPKQETVRAIRARKANRRLSRQLSRLQQWGTELSLSSGDSEFCVSACQTHIPGIYQMIGWGRAMPSKCHCPSLSRVQVKKFHPFHGLVRLISS